MVTYARPKKKTRAKKKKVVVFDVESKERSPKKGVTRPLKIGGRPVKKRKTAKPKKAPRKASKTVKKAFRRHPPKAPKKKVTRRTSKAPKKTAAKRLTKPVKQQSKARKKAARRPDPRVQELEQRVQELERALAEERERAQALESRAKKPDRQIKILSRSEMEAMLRERKDFFREHFDEYLQIAKSRGLIPEPRYGMDHVKIDTPYRRGDSFSIQIDRELNPDTFETIYQEIRRQSAWMRETIHPVWLGEFVVSAIGEKHIGYDSRTLNIDDPGAQWFQPQGLKSTGIQESYSDVLDSLYGLLESVALDESTITYLNHVSIMGFAKP